MKHDNRLHFPARAALVLVAGLLLAGAVPAVQDLDGLAPLDSYLTVYARHDPGMDVIEGYYQEVFDALLDARLDQQLLDILGGLLPPQDMEQLRGLRDLVAHLLGSVPWAELGKHELIFAEAMRPYGIDTHSEFVPYGGVAMVGCRVDANALPELHAGLLGILQTAVAMTEGEGVLRLEVRDVTGVQLLEDPAAMAGAASALGSGDTLSYRLGIQEPEIEQLSFITLAFQGEHVFFGFGPSSDGMVDESLAALRGEAVPMLAGTERYRQAFQGLPAGGHERVFFDFETLMKPIQTMVHGAIQVGGGDPLASAIAGDVFGLLDCLGSSGAVSHLEGHEVVQDVVFRFKDDPSTRTNPIYQIMAHASDSRSMLAFVPEEATDFRVTGTLDLVPLYKWGCDLLAKRVPKGDQAMAGFTALQAMVALDLENEVLPLLGSESVRITLPPLTGSPLASAETVTITRPTDLDVARRLSQRLDTVIESLVPVLMSEISKNPQLGMLAGFRVEVGPSRGAFTTLKQVELTTPFGSEQQFYGYVGDLAVTSSSEAALTAVLETVAGERANITEGRKLKGLPDGPLAGVSLSSLEGVSQQIANGLQAAPMIIGMVTMGLAQEEPEVAQLINGFAQLLPKIGAVVARADFTKRMQTHTEKWDDGLTWYTRMATLYKTPEERAGTHAADPRG